MSSNGHGRWRFYAEPGSQRPVPIAKEEFLGLGREAVAALVDVMKRYQSGESTSAEVKKLADGGGLLELRVQIGTDPFRLIFFRDGTVNLAVGIAAGLVDTPSVGRGPAGRMSACRRSSRPSSSAMSSGSPVAVT